MAAAGEPTWVGAEPGGDLAGESAGPPSEAGLGAPIGVRDAEDEAVEICQDLIRIPSVNLGEGDGDERAAAEYVAERLAEVGLEPTILQSAPRRTSVVARFEGEDSSRGALLMHGHLDVVAAQPDDWQVDPFAGEIRDGCVWGRGAVDMKDSIAMSLAVVRALARSGRKPPRDLVLAFVADEEAGGVLGARWLVDNRSDLFEGCTEGISEVGGFSYTLRDDLRLYLIETAQKGMAWMRLTATGRTGHGSFVPEDNAVTRLCQAVARLGAHRFPIQLTPTVRAFLDAVSESTGVAFDPAEPESLVARLGSLARLIGASLRNTAHPTQLAAGYKVNVIPGQASAGVDGRFLPGHEHEFERDLDALLGPGIEREWIVHDQAIEEPFEGPLVDGMAAALRAEDPGARPVPFMLAGGTDAKSFARLGIRCYGFSPLRLPPELDFTAMFHGVDERVPVGGLGFGVRVLDRFIAGV